MPDTLDWIEDYQTAFRAANPRHEEDVRVQLWTAGWYRVAMPGQGFGPKKHRQSEIVEWTERLKTKVAKAEAKAREEPAVTALRSP